MTRFNSLGSVLSLAALGAAVAPLPGAALASEDSGGAPCAARSRGELLSMRLLDHYSPRGLAAYWDDWLNGAAASGYVEDRVDPGIENGALSFEVRYCTVDFDDTPIVGSGLLALPATWGTAPTVVYSHGTAVTRFDTPSNPDVDTTFDGPTAMVVFAGHGYNFLAPDLTGFGASSAPRHRYIHTETAARSTLDMLTAVESHWLYRLKSSGRLFNTGYSQGGHTALAFAAEAEAAGVTIEANSIGGGVLDADAWFDWGIEQTESNYLAVYPTFLLLSHQDVYGDVYEHPSDAFAPPFDTTLGELFDMDHTYEEVIAGLPGSVAELLTPEFFDKVHDPRSPIRVHLRDNAVEDVCLRSPIRMFHMLDDDEVPYELSVHALQQLAVCNDVELLDWVGTDHLNTWHETLPGVRDWFDSF
jgi:pimeloyl-ACP methyl ester carboxylesterase